MNIAFKNLFGKANGGPHPEEFEASGTFGSPR